MRTSVFVVMLGIGENALQLMMRQVNAGQVFGLQSNIFVRSTDAACLTQSCNATSSNWTWGVIAYIHLCLTTQSFLRQVVFPNSLATESFAFRLGLHKRGVAAIQWSLQLSSMSAFGRWFHGMLQMLCKQSTGKTAES